MTITLNLNAAVQEQCSPTPYERIRGVVADSLGLRLVDVDAESTFSSLGVDSLEKAQLLIDLEDALNIEIPQEDETKIFRVQDLVKYL